MKNEQKKNIAGLQVNQEEEYKKRAFGSKGGIKKESVIAKKNKRG